MPGMLMAIGGAEDKLGRRTILRQFVRRAGGEGARIAVISTASALGDQATDLYRKLFQGYGVVDVRGLRPLSRHEADADATVAVLGGVTGVFMTGGNQVRLSTVVAGTALGRALLAAHEDGVVIAGTSAGASALSSHMVAFGSGGAAPRQRMAQMCAGLGLLPGVVIDQHFEQRSRIGRLLATVALSPSLLGIGVDEDTAAVFGDDGTFDVIGRGIVTVVDGADVESDAFEASHSERIMVSGAVLHSLPAGWRFDVRSRRLVGRADGSVYDEPEADEPATGNVARMAQRLAAEGADDRSVGRARRRASGGRRREREGEASE